MRRPATRDSRSHKRLRFLLASADGFRTLVRLCVVRVDHGVDTLGSMP